MYYTYVLQSKKDKKFYTGYTKNLKLRFEQHQKGLIESTKNRIPLKLVYYEACLNQQDATHREKYLKTYYGKMFIKNRLKFYLTGLTAEISKATFGLIPQEYKKLKGLKRENLRDHMDDFELILTMLGERTTTEIHKTENSQGVPKLKDDARIGGQIAGSARKQIEKKLRHSIVSKNNFLPNSLKKLKASQAEIAASKDKILKSLKKLR